MKKEKKGISNNTPSGLHPTAVVDRAKSNKHLSQPETADSIQKKDAEIQAEKDKSVLKTKVKPGRGLFDTKMFTEDETGPLSFLTRAVQEHFKLTQAIFKSDVTRWDFPHKIGDRHKKMVMFRLFPQPTVK